MNGRKAFQATVEDASDLDDGDGRKEHSDGDDDDDDALPAAQKKITDKLVIPPGDIGSLVATVVSEVLSGVLGKLGVTSVMGGDSESTVQTTKAAKKPDSSERLRMKAVVRRVYMDYCGIEQDLDWMGHQSVDKEVAQDFATGLNAGPDPEDLRFEMTTSVEKSYWNQKVVSILFDKVKEKCVREHGDIPLPADPDLRKLVVAKFNRSRVPWRKGQLRRDGNTVETEDARQKRLQEEYEKLNTGARARTRRANKFTRRKRVCTKELELCVDNSDKKVWTFLLGLLKTLGPEGMSSDESCTVGHETVYHVKILPWCREMEGYMDMIDEARLLDQDLYSGSGSKPGKRVRDPRLKSTRDAVKNLPCSLYNEKWFAELPEPRQTALSCSKQQFDWMYLIAKATQGRG
ncbi:hypothetical protein C8Q77DRAFT_1153150 [Trametes polyzona]|nr:hypothetical protein C8Q77DRAFT_1153150 [Trametes polyzona]